MVCHDIFSLPLLRDSPLQTLTNYLYIQRFFFSASFLFNSFLFFSCFFIPLSIETLCVQAFTNCWYCNIMDLMNQKLHYNCKLYSEQICVSLQFQFIAQYNFWSTFKKYKKISKIDSKWIIALRIYLKQDFLKSLFSSCLHMVFQATYHYRFGHQQKISMLKNFEYFA